MLLLLVIFHCRQEPEDTASEEEDSDESEEEEDDEQVPDNVEDNGNSKPVDNVVQHGESTTEQPPLLGDGGLNQLSDSVAPKGSKVAVKRPAGKGRDAEAELKTAARQQAELSQRVCKAVAAVCRLCTEVIAAGRATAALYSGRQHEGEAGELERAARRGKEFDARLARGLYQVPLMYRYEFTMNKIL